MLDETGGFNKLATHALGNVDLDTVLGRSDAREVHLACSTVGYLPLDWHLGSAKGQFVAVDAAHVPAVLRAGVGEASGQGDADCEASRRVSVDVCKRPIRI